MSPKGPYKLVTVNSAPLKAFKLMGRVVQDLNDRYTILHVGNAESMTQEAIFTQDSRLKIKLTLTGPETARLHFEADHPDLVVSPHKYFRTRIEY